MINIYGIDKDDNEVYSPASGTQVYKSRYATLNNGDDYYYTDEKGNEVFMIDENGNEVYAENAHGDQIYPKIGGKQVPAKDAKALYYYAKNYDDDKYYPKNEDNEEYMVDIITLVNVNGSIGVDQSTLYAQDSDGNAIYLRRKSDGRPKYPIDTTTGDELYQHVILFGPDIGGAVFGLDLQGNETYARRKNGDEYYPNFIKNQYAETKSGIKKYAVKKNGEIIFDMDNNGNEMYLTGYPRKDCIYFNDENTFIPRYAHKQDGGEFYPIIDGVEIILNARYAVDASKNPFYPQDEFGNEYTLNGPLDEALIYPVGYPLTWDDYVIVTGDNDKEDVPIWYATTEPQVPLENLTRYLLRRQHTYPDYLSTVKAPPGSRRRPPRRRLPYDMKVINRPSGISRLIYLPAVYGILSLVFLMICLVVWLR